jgi:hypothetical protein
MTSYRCVDGAKSSKESAASIVRADEQFTPKCLKPPIKMHALYAPHHADVRKMEL